MSSKPFPIYTSPFFQCRIHPIVSLFHHHLLPLLVFGAFKSFQLIRQSHPPRPSSHFTTTTHQNKNKKNLRTSQPLSLRLFSSPHFTRSTRKAKLNNTHRFFFLLSPVHTGVLAQSSRAVPCCSVEFRSPYQTHKRGIVYNISLKTDSEYPTDRL